MANLRQSKNVRLVYVHPNRNIISVFLAVCTVLIRIYQLDRESMREKACVIQLQPCVCLPQVPWEQKGSPESPDLDLRYFSRGLFNHPILLYLDGMFGKDVNFAQNLIALLWGPTAFTCTVMDWPLRKVFCGLVFRKTKCVRSSSLLFHTRKEVSGKAAQGATPAPFHIILRVIRQEPGPATLGSFCRDSTSANPATHPSIYFCFLLKLIAIWARRVILSLKKGQCCLNQSPADVYL
eukprot:scaffold252752_cov19-Tisochrysis_lutea.AAC.1